MCPPCVSVSDAPFPPFPTSLCVSTLAPSLHSYEMLMENLLDPAHVPFAHHKYQGDRNKARPLPSMVVTSITPRGIEGTSFSDGPAAVVPPCTLIQKLFIGGKVLPPAKSRREILDRQRFHVRLCPDCQRVQRWSDRLRIALWAAALLLLAATALFPLAPPAVRQAAGPTGPVFAAVAAVVCGAAAHWLKGFIERNYVYEDFVHALWYPAKK
ncbi:unnamed protein product [Closterium sp. Yama58-4]|nr:unnamed protein product [Closterium sp. Yama58-4]